MPLMRPWREAAPAVESDATKVDDVPLGDLKVNLEAWSVAGMEFLEASIRVKPKDEDDAKEQADKEAAVEYGTQLGQELLSKAWDGFTQLADSGATTDAAPVAAPVDAPADDRERQVQRVEQKEVTEDPELEADEPRLLLELAHDRLLVRLALVEPAPGRRPHRPGRELEAHEQDPVARIEHDGTGRLP